MLNRLPLKFSYSLFAIVLLFSACKSVKKAKEKCQEDEESCDGNRVNICLDGKWTILQDCSSSDMTCQVISGSAKCIASGGDIGTEVDVDTDVDADTEVDVDTEVDSAVDDSDIGTDVEKVVGASAASICNCVGKIFGSESGLDWMRDSCVANADESCISCLEEKLGRDCAALVPSATVLAMVECADRCPRSITTLTEKDQCLEFNLALDFPGAEKDRREYAECVCSNCFSSVRETFSNPISPATIACLFTPTGGCVDPECTQETPCEKMMATISLMEPEENDPLAELVDCENRYNCLAYLGLYQGLE